MVSPLIQLINDQLENMIEKYGMRAHFVKPFSQPAGKERGELSRILADRSESGTKREMAPTSEN